jgi:hypothetical protein
VTLSQEGAVLKGDGVLATEVVLGGPVEEAARHGRYPGTADLVTIEGTGLCVTDYKTHWKMEAQYADRELRQTARSWQLRQYAWFVQERYGQPVTKVRKLLVAFTPALKVWSYTSEVTQQALSEWYEQADQVWALMDIAPRWRNPLSCEQFGWAWRCGYYEHCWDGADLTYEMET